MKIFKVGIKYSSIGHMIDGEPVYDISYLVADSMRDAVDLVEETSGEGVLKRIEEMPIGIPIKSKKENNDD